MSRRAFPPDTETGTQLVERPVRISIVHRSSFIVRPRAFSLIEFTVVLALIGLLAGIVTIGVRPMLVRGKQNAARAELATIRSALETYYSVYGHYPSNEEGLLVLTQKSENLTEPLLSQVPVDPWGRAYTYKVLAGGDHGYDVICLGGDGREGGTGADLDISCWDLKEKVKPGK